MTEVTVDTNDDEGVYVLVGEGRHQSPIVLETEGFQSDRGAARTRATASRFTLRYCICRLVPVEGNELVLKDMERLQK